MRSVTMIALIAWTVPAAAQQRASYQMPEEYREVQVRQLEAQRRLLTAMADSMPERLYRDRVTPIQRDFANQLYHAASSAAFIAARFALDEPMPFSPDTAQVLNRRGAMTGFINQVYDWAVEAVNRQSQDSRLSNVAMFGMNLPRWQVWDEINQHTIWTAGQVVANFRKHGMAPPAFLFF